MAATMIASLVRQIKWYKWQYYTGQPTISDADYDAIEDALKELDPENPILSFVGYDPNDNGYGVPE